MDTKPNKSCKNIAKFITFHQKTMLHWNRNKSKKAKVELDLTEKTYATYIDTRYATYAI